MRIPEDLSIETQKKLCDQHVAHFKKLIERGNNGDRTVRVAECESYVKIWTLGRLALETGIQVPKSCASEMEDALYSGEADELMTPEELERWNKYMAEQEGGEDGEPV